MSLTLKKSQASVRYVKKHNVVEPIILDGIPTYIFQVNSSFFKESELEFALAKANGNDFLFWRLG